MKTLSSMECVHVLLRLGYVIEDVNDARVALSRDGRRVFIHRHKLLSPEEIRVLLFVAGIDEDAFAHRASSPRRGLPKRAGQWP